MLDKEMQSIRDRSKFTGERDESPIPASASRSRKETKTDALSASVN